MGRSLFFFTDLSLVKKKGEPNEAQLLLFSSYDQPLDRTESNDYGFYVKPVKTLKLKNDGKPEDTIYNNAIEWQAGEKKFSAKAKVTYKEGGKEDFLVKHTTPDYDKLWKNGLNGLVVMGTNIKSSVHIMDYYLSYYKREGFVCNGKEGLKEIKNLKKFILQNVESGKMDYFIKEAHSDGDEKNMFYLDKTAFSLTCEHKEKNESVVLVFPNRKEDESVPLSNSEFSESMLKRDKVSTSPLIYFNTSCSSAMSKASNEVEAIANKHFINIPALNEVTTFTDNKNGAEKLLFTAFRNRASYQQMREALMNNETYRKNEKNNFIFPDEPDYKTYIEDKIQIPLQTDIQIYTQNGKRYYMDLD